MRVFIFFPCLQNFRPLGSIAKKLWPLEITDHYSKGLKGFFLRNQVVSFTQKQYDVIFSKYDVVMMSYDVVMMSYDVVMMSYDIVMMSFRFRAGRPQYRGGEY